MNALFSLVPEAVLATSENSKDAILDRLSRLFAEVYDLDMPTVRAALLEREQLGSTGFGRRFAIPHARIGKLNWPVAAIMRLSSPVDFDSADGQPVDIVFGLLSPEGAGASHLHALAAISRTMRDERMHEALVAAPGPEAIYSLLSNVIDRDAA
ncbi:transcriptional regulator [Novosphingobium sp. PC22D]|uniref:PTS sugar transporter subunit IIA n=1 Tax=Novosphingobium sp. PC22D TaxID=1962403 RepID=UPI000BF0449F|nr:PTS sugar transporter subunit IIA [Novosphingobium sp. PC22D]PEQ12143.1 transcriptional regulator [Novosphingobium sp. PC22D]